MKNDVTWIEDLIHSGRVTRYHNKPMLTNQTTADHSWGVLCCVLWLTNGEATTNLLKAAAVHDTPEIATGDLPAPVKNDNPELKSILNILELNYLNKMGLNIELDEQDKQILSMADTMELMMHCIKEMNMGNRYAISIYNKGREYLEQKYKKYLFYMRSDSAGYSVEEGYPEAIKRVETFLNELTPF